MRPALAAARCRCCRGPLQRAPVVSKPSTKRMPISDSTRSSVMPAVDRTRHSWAPMSVSLSGGGPSP